MGKQEIQSLPNLSDDSDRLAPRAIHFRVFGEFMTRKAYQYSYCLIFNR